MSARAITMLPSRCPQQEMIGTSESHHLDLSCAVTVVSAASLLHTSCRARCLGPPKGATTAQSHREHLRLRAKWPVCAGIIRLGLLPRRLSSCEVRRLACAYLAFGTDQMRIWPVCLFIALLALVCLPGGRADAEAGDELPVVVTGVVDGETLTVRLTDGSIETLRLIGIDAPAGDTPGRAAGCLAREAAARP
jgi:hypothetical protein